MPKRVLNNPDILTSTDIADLLGYADRHGVLAAIRRGDIPDAPRRKGQSRVWTREEAEELVRRVKV